MSGIGGSSNTGNQTMNNNLRNLNELCSFNNNLHRLWCSQQKLHMLDKGKNTRFVHIILQRDPGVGLRWCAGDDRNCSSVIHWQNQPTHSSSQSVRCGQEEVLTSGWSKTQGRARWHPLRSKSQERRCPSDGKKAERPSGKMMQVQILY